MSKLSLSLLAAGCMLFGGTFSVPAQQPADATSLYQLDVMEGYFFRARINWLNLDDQYAAIEIRKAREFARIVANVQPPQNTIYFQLRDLLAGLESKLEKGEDVRLRDLHMTFAKVHTTFATFHYARARLYLGQDRQQATAYALRHAFSHLAHAFSWSGQYVAACSEPFDAVSNRGWRANRRAVDDMLKQLEAGTADMEAIKKIQDQAVNAVRNECLKLEKLLNFDLNL